MNPSNINRRNFLRHGAIGAAGVGALGARALWPAEGRVVGANDRLNVGIIGVGGRGGAILGELLKLGESAEFNHKIVAVCDVYERRLQAAARRADAKTYRDYHDLLAHTDLDAVVIAAPDHWHAQMSIDAMRAGKDIYCEKPMTLYWHEAKEVARVARETGRITQIGVQSSSDPRYWKAHDIVAAGGIGPLIWSQTGSYRNVKTGDWNWPIHKNAGPKASGEDHIDWKRWLGPAAERPWEAERFFRFRKFWDYSGGQATDLLYHSLGHHEVVLGFEFPKRVIAGGGNYIFNLENDNREVPDTFLVVIDFPTDHSTVMVSTQVSRSRVAETIRGRKGTITFEGGSRREPRALVVTPEEPFKDEVEPQRIEFDPIPPDEYPHMRNFLQCVRSRKECNLNARNGYKVMVSIALSVQAYREQKVMLFDPKREEVIT